MKSKFLLLSCICLGFVQACAQPNTKSTSGSGGQRVGGPCEGCEAIYESRVPFEALNWVDTLPGAALWGVPLEVSGIVYWQGSLKPVAGVVLYVYHTDPSGIYLKKGDEKGVGKRHGYLRGWMRTNERGEYKFITSRPGAYPNSIIPSHIHLFIKEPNLNEYYVDDFLFADDPLLTAAEKDKLKDWGGSGILTPVLHGGKWKATRNIALGLHIPNYPKQ